MNAKEIIADFQFMWNRVKKFNLETGHVEERGKADLFFDIDYEYDVEENDDRYFGVLFLIVKAKAKIKNKNLFKLELIMEGGFSGNSTKISKDKFINMLEMNGMINLMHISRAYILSVTAQSGINPPLRMPMINLLKLRERKQKERGQQL